MLDFNFEFNTTNKVKVRTNVDTLWLELGTVE